MLVTLSIKTKKMGRNHLNFFTSTEIPTLVYMVISTSLTTKLFKPCCYNSSNQLSYLCWIIQNVHYFWRILPAPSNIFGVPSKTFLM
uniref:Putative ovule protein n=1 Tax=Solanum chacoense TaxID=4108 RepID=A0A0V0GNU5_SOLCH